jgi:hypothetical protein
MDMSDLLKKETETPATAQDSTQPEGDWVVSHAG